MLKHKKVHIDFETRSTENLRKSGTHRYVLNPHTDVLCIAFGFDNEPIQLWKLGDPPPSELIQAIQLGIKVKAHNAHFEFMVWNFICFKKYGWKAQIKINQCDCTMIRAYAMGLPGSLEEASKSVGMKVGKDAVGSRIMLQLSQPRSYDQNGDPVWWEIADSTPKMDIVAKYERLYSYCIRDVEVEKELDARLLPLSKREMEIWRLDQKINFRGVYCDTDIAAKAIELVKIETKRLNRLMQIATGNQVGTCNSSTALKDFINKFDIYKGEIQKEDGPLKTYRQGGKSYKKHQWKKGEKRICYGVGKDQVKDMLDMPDLPEEVREALLLRQEASKSSTAKLKSMIEGASFDQRLRGCFQYYGAASTGRWAGRRIQLHNFTRPTIKQDQIEEIIDVLDLNTEYMKMIDTISCFHGPVVPRLSDILRGLLRSAPGKILRTCDFSAIEARVLAWLAGQESILNVFRSHGLIYEFTASQIYNVNRIEKVTKDQRLLGKVATLALGYQGGVNAFHSMAKNYLVKVPDTLAEKIKVNWRAANPYIVQYWYDLERAAIAATENPGQKFAAGPKERRVIFLKKGSFLFCRLPSGRAIVYPYPKMQIVKTPWGDNKKALTYKGEENRHFIKKVAYGGLLAENITQAVARDLLVEAMFRLEKKGYNIIMHVHDEIVTENPKSFGSLKEVEELMSINPIWAKGLPIQSEGWEGIRYRK